MKMFKKLAVFATLAAFAVASLPAEALAGGRHYGGYGGGYYGGGYYGGHHGHKYRRHHGHGNNWVPFAIIGGLAAGLIIADAASDNRNSRSNYNNYNNAPPPPNYGGSYQQSYNNYNAEPCNVVHRVEVQGGERVKMGATMCYDSNGTAYIVEGSQFVVEYLD